MNNRISIIINTCDSYHEVLPILFNSFNEHWKDCNYPIHLNSETKTFNYNNLNLKSHTIESNESFKWGYRLKKTLKSINSDYVILLLDDYILESDVDNKLIDLAIKTLDTDKDVGCIYLYPVSTIINTKYKSLSYDNDKIQNFEKIDNSSLYRVNTAPAIWDKYFLNKILSKYDEPWSWETFSGYQKVAQSKIILSIKEKEKIIYNYAAKEGGAIYRGKWVRQIIEPKINKYNLKIDLTKRGYYEKHQKIKRNLMWKIQFILAGYRIAGFKVIDFIFTILKKN